MRLKTLLLTGAVAFGAMQTNAQNWVTDTVEMGPGYGNDVYYSMKNGKQGAVNNMNWHLAFQTTPQGPYGNVSVFANHAQTGVKIYSLHLQASTNFATLSAADTVGKTGDTRQVFNSDHDWNFGALNQMNNTADPFDYSWGRYNMVSHNVEGDSLYLVSITTGSTTEVYKLWIKKYVSTPADSVQWQFEIAKFDGTNDNSVRIYRKPTFTDKMFAYYDIVNNMVIDREPVIRSDWDIIFTRYKEYIQGAPGIPYYNVMGVLSNFDVSVYQKGHAAENDTVGFVGYPYSNNISEIGSDWKVFDNSTLSYTLTDSLYYFVKSKHSDEYYQLQFLSFGGSTDGKVIFRKRYLADYIATSVAGVTASANDCKLVPNPANSEVKIMLASSQNLNKVSITVRDMAGRTVYESSNGLVQGNNTFSVNTATMPSGFYIVTVAGNGWKQAQKLVVQH